MRSALRRFARASHASVLTTFAVVLPVLLGTAAFGIDVGVLFLERRTLQKAADAAALAAAVDLDHASTAIQRMLAANGQEDARFMLALGRYREDAALPRDARFAPDTVPNAVSIELTRRVPTLFGRVFEQRSALVGVRSQAAVMPIVSFAIGSRLASASPPVVDALLQPLIGSPLGLDVMDYRALARSQVGLGAILRRFATTGGIAAETATVRDVLRKPLLLSAMLTATATELSGAGDPAGAMALRKAASNTASLALRIAPADILGLDESAETSRLDYPGDALGARLSVLSLLAAAVTDRSIGNEATASLQLPGVLRVDLAVVLGEAEAGAQAAVVGRVKEGGPSAATAQARLRLTLHSDASRVLPGVRAEIPVELVAAGAEARVVSATCSADPAKREVRLAVYPGLARLSLGHSNKALGAMKVGDTVQPAVIASAPAASVTAGGSTVLRSIAPASATFRGAEIGNGTVKTVRTRNLLESPVATLFSETQIGLRLGSLGLDLALPDTIKQAARTLLADLVRPADTLVEGALAAAGIGFGEADLRVDALVCGRAKLVG